MSKPKGADETMAMLDGERERALAVLAQSAERAVKTVVALLDCERPSVRVAAAELVLGIVGCRARQGPQTRETNVVIGVDVAERLFRVDQETGPDCVETVCKFLVAGDPPEAERKATDEL